MSYVLIVTFSNAPFLRAPDSTLVSKPKIIAFEAVASKISDSVIAPEEQCIIFISTSSIKIC